MFPLIVHGYHTSFFQFEGDVEECYQKLKDDKWKDDHILDDSDLLLSPIRGTGVPTSSGTPPTHPSYMRLHTTPDPIQRDRLHHGAPLSETWPRHHTWDRSQPNQERYRPVTTMIYPSPSDPCPSSDGRFHPMAFEGTVAPLCSSGRECGQC